MFAAFQITPVKADINSDLKVDGKDIATVAKYYNTH
jgi:hypothetical protein